MNCVSVTDGAATAVTITNDILSRSRKLKDTTRKPELFPAILVIQRIKYGLGDEALDLAIVAGEFLDHA